MGKLTYETEEVIYTITGDRHLMNVDLLYKGTGDDEEGLLKLICDKNGYSFISLPPLFATEKLYRKKFESIKEALDEWECFIENY